MTQINAPGYPLPDGELGDDEIVCQLVYLPDRPEYWQALLGAISYMATWKAWERDSDKRGKDAAANWREAFELTMECWRMTCLEQLQSDVSNILALMRNSDSCCGDTITYGDSTTYITIIVPGDGDPPEFYGETAVSDWDEWYEYLCHNANLWVDELIRAAGTVEVALSTGGMSIALLAAIIAAIAFFVVGGVLALPLLMIILFGLGTGVSAAIFETAATDLEDAREDITCAILTGRSVSDAVEDALSSGTAWDLLYSFIDYESSVAILYEGGDGDTVFLEAETDDTCSCICHHFVSVDDTHNPIVYQSSSGAQWVMERWFKVVADQIDGSFRLNHGAEFCGPMKEIDSISVSDGLWFNRLQTKNADGDIIEDWFDPTGQCTIDPQLLVGEQCQRFTITRQPPINNGCGVGDITITITYHDV